jgi:CheY-like chemotaxis protein
MEFASQRSHASGQRKELSGKTLLCIDDHADTLMMMRVLLESHGAELLSAESVHEAMNFLRKRSIDLVICDMMMSDGGAPAVTEALNKGGRLIPVIALSGLRERQCWTGAGKFVAYLMKPVDEPLLVGTILNVLDGAIHERRVA